MISVSKRQTTGQTVIELKFLGGIYQEIENQFREMDYEPVLRLFGEEMRGAHYDYFGRRAGPTGSVWPALAASTILRKGHDTILVDKTPLKASLTDPTGTADSVREYTHRGMVWGTRDAKSIFHQFGTVNMPKRGHVGLTGELIDVLVSAVADTVVEGLKA